VRREALEGNRCYIDPYDVDSDRDDPEVMITEWIWSKAPVSCPWVKESKTPMTSMLRKPIGPSTCC
jgi:hypothetical protein